MPASRRVPAIVAKPLDRFGDWFNNKLMQARDKFNTLTREMDERSSRVRD